MTTWPTLVEAAQDRQLLGATLKPTDHWSPRQLELLERVQAGPERIHLWRLGRRSAKTTMGSLAALHGLIFRPDLDALMRRREQRFAIAVAVNQPQARIMLDSARAVVQASPMLTSRLVGQSADELRFESMAGGRATLRAIPTVGATARGLAVSFLLFDELAHVPDEVEGQAGAAKVWEALLPSTAQFGRLGRVVAASTPYGESGLFHELVGRALAGELPDAVATCGTSAEMNPTIVTPEFLAGEEARDVDAYRQEYLAEPAAAAGQFVDLDRVDVPDRGALAPGELAQVVVGGLDPSFARDATGLVILGRRAADPRRLVLARCRALPSSGSFEATMGEAAAEFNRYGCRLVAVDQYSSEAVRDRLEREGIGVRVIAMSASSKTSAYQELRNRLYAGDVELYPDPLLLGELRRLRTRFSPGMAAVYCPRSGSSHGDVVSALAVAVYHVRRQGGEGIPTSGGVPITAGLSESFGGRSRLPSLDDQGPW